MMWDYHVDYIHILKLMAKKKYKKEKKKYPAK